MPPMTDIKIANRPPFTEPVEIKCDPKVNVIIGPNGVGKSALIRYIGGLEHDGPCVTVPTARLELPFSSDFDGLSALIRGRLENRDLAAVMASTSEVFDSSVVYYIRHLMEERLSTQPQSPQVIDSYFKALSISYRCTQQICAEILADEAPTNYLRQIPQIVSYVGRTADGRQTRTNHEVGKTSTLYEGMAMSVKHDIAFDRDATYNKLFMGDLSNGTQGTLSWIQYLTLRIAFHHEFQTGWEGKPAVLLIDEVENHLHPTWQRRVIPGLLKHFPELQIFATTHSPFVVAGLKAGQVHRLYRDEAGIVRAEAPNDANIVGWTVDEILRSLMAVQDPTDEDTAQAARELRELQNQAPLTPAAEEEKRQQRIQELRRMVDRDLLAGGIVAAEQELFEQQFNEVLQRYRQTKSASEEDE